MSRSHLCFLVFLIWLCSFAHAQAQDDGGLSRDLIHSDLPLFGDETADKWPRAFSHADDFGCGSRIEFGDWVFRATDADGDDVGVWYTIWNYGVFHCWAEVSRADRREQRANAEGRPSFFVLLGRQHLGNRDLELWALQLGARPGSDYLLLARTPGGEGPIQAFDVLQRQCPIGRARRGHSVDILLVDYCAINSRSELKGLARRMAMRPPLGSLTRVSSASHTP